MALTEAQKRAQENYRKFDYQSDRHCSKTAGIPRCAPRWFDYQSDRHCSKTESKGPSLNSLFDYQSDRHCSKTAVVLDYVRERLITSQIDTAPKLIGELEETGIWRLFKPRGAQ